MPDTPNFALPLLFAAQAQKEITHNEAIAVIDAVLTGCIEAVANDPASLAPQEGQMWIIGSAPVGAWSARAGQLALFTAGGWRFIVPMEGLRLLDRSANLLRMRRSSGWSARAAIADPAGGTTIDNEARLAIAAILAALRESAIVAAT